MLLKSEAPTRERERERVKNQHRTIDNWDISKINFGSLRRPRYQILRYFLASLVFGIFSFSSVYSLVSKQSLTAVLGVSEKTSIKTGVEESNNFLASNILGVQDSGLSLSNESSTTLFTFAGTNLLRNSSFEQEQGSNQPRYWNYMLDSTTGNTFRSAEGIHSGAYGLKFAGNKGTGNGLNLGISQPDTKTVPGRTYTFSAYIKLVNISSTTIRLGFWNEHNNKYGEIKSFDYSQNFDWKRISFTVTTPGIITDSKNYYPIIEVRGLGTGSVYLDDVKLEEGNVLTGFNSASAYSNSAFSSLGGGSILGRLDGNLYPATSGVGGLGTSSNSWNSLYLSNATIDKDGNLTINGGSTIKGDETIEGSATIKGNTTLGDSSSDTITTTGRFNTSLIPSATTTYDLGSPSLYWDNFYAKTLNISSGQSIGGNLSVTGNLDVAGITSLSSATLSQGLGLNGGEVTSNSTSFNLLDSVVDILNFGREVTSMILGATSGTATIRNSITALSGTLNVNGAGDSYFTGELGIGTTNPSFTLDVNGDIRVQGGELYLTGISSSSSTTEGTIYYDTDDDQLKVYANGKWQADRSTATLIVATSDSQNKEKADYVADGTADDVQIQAAISALPAGGGRIILLDGTYNITATIAMSAGSEIIGQGWSTIIDVSGISSGAAVSLGSNSVLANIKIQGDITPLTAADRQIIAGNHSKIQRIWINENDGGIETANKVDVHINDIYATQIHDSNGWASVIHSSGTANGIFVDGVYIDNADRGFEVEGGAKNFFAKNGYLKTVKVTGSYSFVLDVHTHEGDGGVENVVYENFYLEDTEGLTAQGAGSDISKNITFKNITMVNPVVSTGRCTVNIAIAEKVTVDGLYVTNTATDDNLCAAAGSEKVVFNDVDFLSYGRPDLSVAGKNVTLQNSRFKNTQDAEYGLNISGSGGSHILLDNVHVYDCRGYGCIQLTGGSLTYVTIQNSLLELDASDPGTYGITASGGAPLKILGNKILGSPTSAAVSIESNANAVIAGNYLTTAWDSVWVRSTASNTKIYQNELASTRKVILDQGSGGTKIYRNINYVTENSGIATVPNGSTYVDVTHSLSASPSASRINVVPSNNLGSATKFWVSNPGANTFRINTDVDPGATTATFNWNVSVY